MVEEKQASSSEQIISSEPIYRINSAVDDFNRLVNIYRGKLMAPFNCKLSEVKNFQLIRRAWEECDTTSKDNRRRCNAWFNFTYFPIKNFSNAYGIADSIRSDSDVWRRFFGYLTSPSRQKISAIRTSVRWVVRNVLDPKNISQNDEFPKLLHHHLLQLFTRFPVDGLIPKTLYDLHKKLIDKRGKTRGYLVETIPERKATDLPSLAIWQILESGNPIPTQPTKQSPLGIDNDFQTLFVFFLDRLFRERNFDPSTYKETTVTNTGSLEKRRDRMLWLPIYDEYTSNGFRGCFQGWLFMFLPPVHKEESSSRIAGSNDFREFVRHCLPLTNILSKDLYLAATREVLRQDLKSNEQCSDFLCERLHLMEGWSAANALTDKAVEIGANQTILTAIRDSLGGSEGSGSKEQEQPKYYYYDKDGAKLYIDLEVSRLDAGTEVSLEEIREEPRILELKFGPDFVLQDIDEEYIVKVVVRLRSLYSRLKSNKKALRSYELQLGTDLAATFSHTYIKIGETVKDLLDSFNEDRRYTDLLNIVSDANSLDELTTEIFSKIGQYKKEAVVNPIRENYSYFFKSLKTFYDSMTVADRVPKLIPGEKLLELRAYISSVYEVFIKIARYLQQRNIAATITELGRQYNGDLFQALVFDGLEGIYLREPVANNEKEQEVQRVYTDLRESMFLELFLNAFSNQAIGSMDCSLDNRKLRVAFDKRLTGLSFTNFVSSVSGRKMFKDDANQISGSTFTRSSGWNEYEVVRPSQDQGTSGWGMYGIKNSVESLMKLGELHRYYHQEKRLGAMVINLNPDWIHIKDE